MACLEAGPLFYYFIFLFIFNFIYEKQQQRQKQQQQQQQKTPLVLRRLASLSESAQITCTCPEEDYSLITYKSLRMLQRVVLQ